MPKLSDVVLKVRSKNAGPFWVTIDIFCGTDETYEKVVREVSTEQVAQLFQQPTTALKRFDIPYLKVVKYSLPRPIVQGSRFDRDMHGAQYAVLLAEFEL